MEVGTIAKKINFSKSLWLFATLCILCVYYLNIYSSSAGFGFLMFKPPLVFDTLRKSTEICPRSDNRNRELIYYERNAIVQNMCLVSNLTDTSRRIRSIISSSSHNLSYCSTPKVGCTFWINIFRFISNSTGSVKYSSPFNIPRILTHYAPKDHMEFQTFINSDIIYNRRVLFVREPYSRLWSAFLDKFVLPDFWRNGEIKAMAKRKGLSPSVCPVNITFSDFLEHVVSQSPSNLNEHWSPYKYLCDPCLFRPHVIGKMETFIPDVSYVLRKSGLEWILNDTKSRNHAMDEIQMLSDYNFYIAKRMKKCLNLRKISEIMWSIFQYNGYIRFTSLFPVKSSSYWNLDTFKFEVSRQYKLDNITSRESKTIRDQVLRKAYSKIPDDILIKMRELYKEDFEMFGYDINLIALKM